jgi:ATP-dependent Clp protease ATP-binding subunit ClpA
MTTNAGSDHSAATVGFSLDEHATDTDKTMKALSNFLRPEFINRVDEIITFRSLNEGDFGRIACIMLDELKLSLAEKKIAFTYSQPAVDYIAKHSYSYKFGARNIRRFICNHVEDPIAEKMIADYTRAVKEIALKYSKKEDQLVVECK